MFRLPKIKLRGLVEKAARLSIAADKAYDKIPPINKKINGLEEDLKMNKSHYGKYRKPEQARLQIKIEAAINRRNIKTARFEVVLKKYTDVLAEVNDYVKGLIGLPTGFYDRAKIIIEPGLKNIQVMVDDDNGSYQVETRSQKVTCFKQFVVPAV